MGVKSTCEYLTPEQLEGFTHYKYSAIDTNPLSNYVCHPFWNTVVKAFPEWIAPNILTFVGFMFTVGNFLMFSYYDYTFHASDDTHKEYMPIPKWVFMMSAINLFAYHTLDGIDGKQARRTGTSGPLGELFDHGLDSWTSVFIPVCLYSVFGRGDHSISPLRFYLCLWNVFICFICSHWEKYNTGVLFLPWGYDISVLISVLIYGVTAIFGYEMWKFTILERVTPGIVCEVMMWAGSLVLSLPMSLYNLYMSYKNETGKMLSFWEAMRPMVSPVLFFSLTLVWALISPINILMYDPRMFYFMTGTIFSNICCRLIVNQMSNTRCELVNSMLWGVAACLLATAVSSHTHVEYSCLIVLTVTSTLLHIHYGVLVVSTYLMLLMDTRMLYPSPLLLLQLCVLMIMCCWLHPTPQEPRLYMLRHLIILWQAMVNHQKNNSKVLIIVICNVELLSSR